jgi:O-antigen/teichoic acid export membrane protein
MARGADDSALFKEGWGYPAPMSTGGMTVPDVPSEGPSRHRHLAGGALASASAQVAVFVAMGLTSIAIARLLGPAGNGALALVYTLYAVLVIGASIGLRSGFIYEVSTGAWSSHEAAAMSRLIAAALGLAGGALGIGLYALTQETVLSGLSWPMALMVGGAIPFGMAWLFGVGIVLARERYELQAALMALPQALVLLVGVSLAIPFGITGAIAGFAAAQVVAGIAATTAAGRDVSHKRFGSTDQTAGRLQEAVRFGTKTWIQEILTFVSYRIDIFVLNAFVATSELGIYSVAAAVTAIAWILPQGLANVVLPRAASIDAAAMRGEISAAESDESLARPVRHAVLLTPPIGAGIALLLVAVPLLYGSEFEDSVELGLILLPGVLALGVARVLMAGTVGRGHPEYTLYTSLLAVPVMVALYLVLIPEYEATGAALGSCIGYLLIGLVAAYYFQRTAGLGLRAYVPVRRDLDDYRALLPMVAQYARDARRRMAA